MPTIKGFSTKDLEKVREVLKDASLPFTADNFKADSASKELLDLVKPTDMKPRSVPKKVVRKKSTKSKKD